MKNQPPQSSKKGSRQSTSQKPWSQMNRKQRREMQRKIQSQDLNLEVVHPSESDLGVDCLLNLCRCRVGKVGRTTKSSGGAVDSRLSWPLSSWEPHHLKQFGATQATLESYTAVMCCEEPHHCKQEVCSGITLK
jgi:hypothetical protein